MRIYIFFIAWGLMVTGFAQQIPIELRLAEEGRYLPENLTSVRTGVIIDCPNSQNWKEISKKVHNQLRQMGIDAIVYINYRDLSGSLQLRNKFIEFLNIRHIRNIVMIHQAASESRLLIGPYSETGQIIDLKGELWYSQSATLNDVLYELALGIKGKDYEFTNFLIPDQPEFYVDMPLFKGTHFPSYPTRIKRFPLAVTRFAKYVIDSTNASSEQMAIVHEYNREIEEKNRQMEKIFESYNYEYEFTEPITDDVAYQKGYQFVLRFFHTSGVNIKKLLNYEINAQETDYITIVPLEGGGRTLKTIPIEKPVYKFYIKQTIAGDVYVGRHWDASENWEDALKYFLQHMQNEFED